MRKSLKKEYERLWEQASLVEKKALLATGFDPHNPYDAGVPRPHRSLDADLFQSAPVLNKKGSACPGSLLTRHDVVGAKDPVYEEQEADDEKFFNRNEVLDIISRILSVLDESKEAKVRLHATCIKMAVGMPGQPTMTELSKHHGISRAGVSWHVKSIQKRLGLPTSCYMKSQKACDNMSRNHKKKRK